MNNHQENDFKYIRKPRKEKIQYNEYTTKEKYTYNKANININNIYHQ